MSCFSPMVTEEASHRTVRKHSYASEKTEGLAGDVAQWQNTFYFIFFLFYLLICLLAACLLVEGPEFHPQNVNNKQCC